MMYYSKYLALHSLGHPRQVFGTYYAWCLSCQIVSAYLGNRMNQFALLIMCRKSHIVAKTLSENLPVWKHWVFNMQTFAPRLKPADIFSHLTPETFRVVPCRSESSAVSAVGCIVPAALYSKKSMPSCSCMRSCCAQASF